MKDLGLRARAVVRTSSMRNSRCHLTDYVKNCTKKRDARVTQLFSSFNQSNQSHADTNLSHGLLCSCREKANLQHEIEEKEDTIRKRNAEIQVCIWRCTFRHHGDPSPINSLPHFYRNHSTLMPQEGITLRGELTGACHLPGVACRIALHECF